MVRRHEIQVLRRAGHSLDETAKLVGVSRSSVQRVAAEPLVKNFDTEAERAQRAVGRPSKAEPFRSFLIGELSVQPDVLSVELLRRVKLKGYGGSKTASARSKPATRYDTRSGRSSRTLARSPGAGPGPAGTGALAVRWAQDAAPQFHLQVVSPAGTRGEVWVPLLSAGGTSAAPSSGATLLRGSGNYDVYQVGAGTFEFSFTP